MHLKALMMKKIFTLIFIVAAVPATMVAQVADLDVFAGFANYQGDLQDKRFSLNQSHAAFGAGFSYEVNSHFIARLGFTAGKVGADDKKSENNKARNLNFTSSVSELSLRLEYQVLSLYDHKVSPYIFGGIAQFKFNPYTTDSIGNKILLQKLGTEGQGFTEGRKKYDLKQFSIPFGGGIRFNLSSTIVLGFEAGLRKTSTDYLDDVSTTYVNEFDLFNNRGQKAVDISYRGDEIPGGSQTYPAAGTQRGSPKSKDWYYFSGIHVIFRLNNDQEPTYGGGRSRKTLGCPVF